MMFDQSNSCYINIEKYVSTLLCPTIKINELGNSLSVSDDRVVALRLLEKIKQIYEKQL